MHFKSETSIYASLRSLLSAAQSAAAGKHTEHTSTANGYLDIQRAFILPLDREDLCDLYSQLARLQHASAQLAKSGGNTALLRCLNSWCKHADLALKAAFDGAKGPRILAFTEPMQREVCKLGEQVCGSLWEQQVYFAAAAVGDTVAKIGAKKS